MTATTVAKQSPTPWYREPWPWFLMAGPFIVIIAGFTTAWLAVSSSDGLVAEDYYKQGLAVGETLSRSRKAEELGLAVGLSLTSDSIRIRLSARQADMTPPSGLIMTMSHPTRAGLDQKIALKHSVDAYTGDFQLPASGHWLVVVEDDAKTWRLMGSVMLPAANETVIGEGVNVAKPQS
jgi:hypothetical protein